MSFDRCHCEKFLWKSKKTNRLIKAIRQRKIFYSSWNIKRNSFRSMSVIVESSKSRFSLSKWSFDGVRWRCRKTTTFQLKSNFAESKLKEKFQWILFIILGVWSIWLIENLDDLIQTKTENDFCISHRKDLLRKKCKFQTENSTRRFFSPLFSF